MGKDKNAAKDKAKVHLIKLVIAAGKANPAPPVGPALGSKGVNIQAFCKEFNDRTAKMSPGTPVPVEITVKPDKSFSFITKNSPTSYLVRQAAAVQKGSSTPGRTVAGVVTMAQLREVAKIKMEEMGVDDVESALPSVVGTARSMGLEIKE